MNGLVATVDPTEFDPPVSQFTLALRRLRDEACAVDPQAAVARFNSAF